MNLPGQIAFLLRRRYPAYTDELKALVSRIARQENDLDLEKISTLQAIADRIGTAVTTTWVPEDVAGTAFPAFDPGDERRLDLTQAAQLRMYLDAARDYEDRLHDSSDDEFLEAYQAELRRENDEQLRAGDLRDRRTFFNAPADVLAKWACQPSWTVEEAASLSLGKDPDLALQAVSKPHIGRSPFRAEYQRRLSHIKGEVSNGRLAEPIAPREFVNWANKLAWSIPTGITAALRDNKSNVREEAQDEDPRPTPQDIRYRNNALRLLAAVAFPQLGINPHSTPRPIITNEHAKTIGALLEALNLEKIGHDTIKDRLKDAIQRAIEDKRERGARH